MMSRQQQDIHALRQISAGREALVKLRAKALDDAKAGGGERARAAASWLLLQITTADHQAEKIRREGTASC